MKKVLLMMVAIVVMSASTFACDLDGLLKGNSSLATKVRAMEKQGYVLVLDQSFYNQHRYLVAPTAPYLDGFGTVVMVKSGTGYSLETTYANINFEASEQVNGRCKTQIIDITYNTVY